MKKRTAMLKQRTAETEAYDVGRHHRQCESFEKAMAAYDAATDVFLRAVVEHVRGCGRSVVAEFEFVTSVALDLAAEDEFLANAVAKDAK